MREQKAKEYLQTIYALQKESEVRGAYIAREMGLTKATVSVALRTLARDGYVTLEPNHAVHLTSQGLLLAKAAIQETVHRGRNYHSMLEQNEDELPESESPEEERALTWLRREGLETLLETVLVLGKHYYRVRSGDVAECLDTSASAVTRRLRRLEDRGLVRMGERGAVSLTASGRACAEILYRRHEPERRRLTEEGLSERDAELSVCGAQAGE